MNNTYTLYHKNLLNTLFTAITSAEPFCLDDPLEDETKFVNTLQELTQKPHQAEDGQWILSSIVTRYPHLTAIVPRELFWFFGGECLHFLGDEEIQQFQERDDAFYETCDKDQRANFDEYAKAHTHSN